MFDVDRTVVRSKRRRGHPVNPFQMVRHGITPFSRHKRFGSGIFGSQAWK
jgi:hypothetical protein